MTILVVSFFMAGRTTYTKKIADQICALLAQGISLRTICKRNDMPGLETVFGWLRKNASFSEQYARAKEEASDALIEEMLDIADDGANDWMETHDPENPGWKFNHEHVQRSKLRVDTRKWYASKLKPKKYGDKVDLTSGGEKFQVNPIIGNGYQGYISGSEQLAKTPKGSDSRRSYEIQSASVAQTRKKDDNSNK